MCRRFPVSLCHLFLPLQQQHGLNSYWLPDYTISNLTEFPLVSKDRFTQFLAGYVYSNCKHLWLFSDFVLWLVDFLFPIIISFCRYSNSMSCLTTQYPNDPPARRSLAITGMSHLEIWKILTFPKMILAKWWYSHYEYTLNDKPEIKPSSSKIQKIFESNFGKVKFFHFDK